MMVCLGKDIVPLCLCWGLCSLLRTGCLCRGLDISEKVGCLSWWQDVSSRCFSVAKVHFNIWGCLSGIWVLNSLSGEILSQKDWGKTWVSLTSPPDLPGSNWRYWSRTLCKNFRCLLPSWVLLNFLLLLIFSYNIVWPCFPLLQLFPDTTHFLPTQFHGLPFSFTLILCLRKQKQKSKQTNEKSVR